MRHAIRVIVLLLAAATLASAEMPRLISYQGFLGSDDGTPVTDGDHDFIFRLYDADTDGTLLWTESQTVDVQEGYFDVWLGAVTALDLTFDLPYWLEIEVDTELLGTRARMTGSPYAFRAAIADSVVGNAPGENMQVIFNDNGVLAGSEFYYDKTDQSFEMVANTHFTGQAIFNTTTLFNALTRCQSAFWVDGDSEFNGLAHFYGDVEHHANTRLLGPVETGVGTIFSAWAEHRQYGALYIHGGTTEGQVLTRDASGYGTWQDVPQPPAPGNHGQLIINSGGVLGAAQYAVYLDYGVNSSLYAPKLLLGDDIGTPRTLNVGGDSWLDGDVHVTGLFTNDARFDDDVTVDGLFTGNGNSVFNGEVDFNQYTRFHITSVFNDNAVFNDDADVYGSTYLRGPVETSSQHIFTAWAEHQQYGALYIDGGSAAGQVLTRDASGYASWQDAEGGYTLAELDARYVEENEPESVSTDMIQEDAVGMGQMAHTYKSTFVNISGGGGLIWDDTWLAGCPIVIDANSSGFVQVIPMAGSAYIHVYRNGSMIYSGMAPWSTSLSHNMQYKISVWPSTPAENYYLTFEGSFDNTYGRILGISEAGADH
jgi:hypothetical protein